MEFVLLVAGVLAWILGRISAAEKRRKEAARDAFQYDADRTFESSDWASEKDLRKARCFVDSGFPVGFSESGEKLYFPDEVAKPNAALFGSSGSGKTSQLIETIISFRGNVVVIDNVGELAAVTAKARQRFGPVKLVAPYRIFDEELGRFEHVGFNPIGPHWIDPNDREMLDVRTARITSAIVLKNEPTTDPYWPNSSSQLINGTTGAVIRYFPPHLRNLTTVASIIKGDVTEFARRMMEISEDPYIRGNLHRFAVMGDVKSLHEVISAARTYVDFLLLPGVADCLSHDGLDPGEVMHGTTSAYLVQPQELVKEMTGFRRVFADAFLGRFMREDATFAKPTLLVIDELYSLGHLEGLDLAFTSVRKLNLRLYISIPSVGLLQQMYPQSFKAILDNCGLKHWFDVNLDDSEMLSALCGEREVVRRSKTVNYSPLFNYQNPSNAELQTLHVTNNKSTERVPLIRPHELRNNLGRDGQIVLLANVPKPIRARRRPYFKIAALRRLAQPNPFIARKEGKRRIVSPTNDNWKKLLKE